MQNPIKPRAMLDEHAVFLDVLRKSGKTNMLMGGVYLREEYPELTSKESKEILFYWMKNCS